ncbi:hypothetical protein GJ744_005272 [Endocarpon pusillum]|uniref:Uncharacterized protein n=1 Tax=Endocarpon pusillum TaxID=364733 RepID=A0A8H7A823_9EURO|nr:hypothetical protein GJ744_005272 [Endocarpon pusillum]
MGFQPQLLSGKRLAAEPPNKHSCKTSPVFARLNKMANGAESTKTGNEQVEMEKSSVTRAEMPAPPKQEYDVGDTVKVSVLEDGVRRPKKMEVAQAELRRNKWKYQIKPVGGGGGESVHQDENGNEWFAEDQLEWW